MAYVLIVEPYYGGSHARFVDGLCRHTRHMTTTCTLPARFWKWRMHGAAVTLARQVVDAGLQPDVIFASDMLDLTTFQALTRHHLADVPAVLYMHENQLTYPPPPGTKRDLHYGWINYASMLAADRVLFNSQYHYDEFFDELPRLLKHFPDFNNLETINGVRSKSQVLRLGVDLTRHDPHRVESDPGPPIILWNQRWEYDKAPATFFDALYHLADEGLDFRVILAGENFRNVPEEFEAARQWLGDRIIHYGWEDAPAVYSRLLWQADIVVSTAIHEFFGLATVEAIYCDCYPILPNRLAYPELLPPETHHRHLYDDLAGLLDRLRWAATHRDELGRHSLRRHVARFDWSRVIDRYDTILDASQ
jgi:glycosyltransferase involved in cell wall biosynthesis